MKTIAQRNHKVAICSMKDVASEGGMRIFRKAVYEGWAAIDSKKGVTIGAQGYTIQDAANRPTHIVTMNRRHDVTVTVGAWIYEARLKSPPRWFKILSVSEKDKQWVFDCRLVEESDEANKPVDSVPEKVEGFGYTPLPEGVSL